MGWKSGQRIAFPGVYHAYSIKMIDFQNEFSLFVSLAMDQTICINCIRNHDGSDQCHSIWNALSGRKKDFEDIFKYTNNWFFVNLGSSSSSMAGFACVA